MREPRLAPPGGPAPRLWAAVALALVVGAVGCTQPTASNPQASPSPRTRATATPGVLDTGWTLHIDSGAGFAVAYPDSWASAQRDLPTLTADLATIASSHPELGSYFSTHLTGGSNGIALLAADPDTLTAGYASNVAVFRGDLGNIASAPSLDGVTRGKIRALGKDSTLSGTIDQQPVTLGGITAERLTYVFKAGANSVHVRSYLLLKDIGNKRIQYELTLGATISDYAGLFDKISGSFTLVSAPRAHPTPSASENATGNSSLAPPQAISPQLPRSG